MHLFLLPGLFQTLFLIIVSFYFLEAYLQSHSQAWAFFLFLGCWFFAFYQVFRMITKSKEHKELQAVLRFIQQIDFASLKKKVPTKKGGFYEKLGLELHQLSHRIEKKYEATVAEQEKLKLVLQAMNEGVLVTDKDGQVILVNEALLRMFDQSNQILGQNFSQCLREPTLVQTINYVLKVEKAKKTEIQLISASEVRSLLMQTVAFFSQKRFSGTVSVFHDVTDLRKLESMRRDFIANISHELKTPLTSIRGFTETLLNTKSYDETIFNRFLAKIEASAVVLQNLVEDILKLSQIESGSFELKPSWFESDDFLKQLERDLNDMALAKQIRLKVVFLKEGKTAKVPQIFADQQALKSVFTNLISNAIKYTPENGQVSFGLMALANPQKIGFYVEDNGMGIDPKDHQRIFERFFRVDKARSRDKGGTGLGLAIVKHLILAHQGKITVKSKLGEGSRFEVILPQTEQEQLVLDSKS